MAKTAKRLRFEDRFKKEREAGNETFEFEGETYSTKLAPSAPPSGGPTRRGRGSPVPQRDEPAPAKSLSDIYEKYPDSLPSKYAPKTSTPSSSPATEAQRTGRAISDARSAVKRLAQPNAGMDTEAERGERANAMSAIQRARVANVQAGNRADESISPGSTYARRMKTGGMVKNIPLPPRRPSDLSGKKSTYPMSDIPVNPEYQKNLEEGYKTPKKPMVVKKAKGGMVRGCGMATRGQGKGKMY